MKCNRSDHRDTVRQPHPCQLREVVSEDLPLFYGHQSDPVSSRMAAFSSRNEQDFMAHWRKILGDDTVFKKAIVVSADVVGNIVCWQQEGKQLVGYWLGREHWGRGFATAAMTQFLEQVPIRPLHAHVAKHNVGSIRVLEKCGFVLQSETQIAVGPEGDPVTECLYCLQQGPRLGPA